MRKNIVKLSLIISALVVGLLLILLLSFLSKVGAPSADTLLMTTISPNESYTLEAYRTEPGATVDFSVKVYAVDGNKKELIYNAYHESEADIVWITDDVVSINGKELDLSQNETYNWKDYS